MQPGRDSAPADFPTAGYAYRPNRTYLATHTDMTFGIVCFLTAVVGTVMYLASRRR